MIASLTFTYGNERMDIFKYKKKDNIDILLRNNIDYNLYIFHNSSIDYINKVRDTNILNELNCKIGTLTGNYPEALKSALYFLKEKGVTKILFFQDDVFSTIKSENALYDLIDYIKTTQDNYLNLELYTEANESIDILHKREHFNIYKTDLKYFIDKGGWSFDDSPYYAKLDYALNTIYDNTYFSYPDIWSAEWYLKAKFDSMAKTTIRPITNKQFFRRVNFIGRHDWNKVAEVDFLNTHFKIE